MSPTIFCGHKLSASSSVLRINWPIFLSLHLLLMTLPMRHGFLMTIVWWPDFLTPRRRRSVTCFYLLQRNCGIPWRWCMKMRRILEIYEGLFELKHEDRSVPEFYGELKSLIDELEMHQSAVTDAAILRGYRQDLAVSNFLSGLSPSLRSQVRGTERRYYSYIDSYLLQSYVCVYWRGYVSCTICWVECHGLRTWQRLWSWSRSWFWRTWLIGGEHGSYGSRQSGFDKAPDNCKHCGRNNHISEKCWEKFGHLKWAQLVDTDSPTPGGATHAP